MRVIRLKIYTALAMALALLLGCKSSDSGSPGKPEPRPIPDTTSLPALGGDGDCGLADGQNSLCFYGLVSEAIVWGQIEGMRWQGSPGIFTWSDNTDGEEGKIHEEFVDECPNGVSRWALEVTLDVERVFIGDLPPGRLAIRITDRMYGTWDPEPQRRFSDDIIEWSANGPNTTGKPLQIGQEIGLALMFDQAHGLWYFSYPLFELQPLPDGKLVTVFQGTPADACNPAPQDGFGLTLDELDAVFEALDSCNTKVRDLASYYNSEIIHGPNEVRSDFAGIAAWCKCAQCP